MSQLLKPGARGTGRALNKGMIWTTASAVVLAAAALASAGSAQAACTGAAVTINGPTSGAYTGANYNLDTGSNSFGTYTTCPTSTTVASGTAEIIGGATYAGYIGTVQNDGRVPIFDFSGAVDTTGNSPQGGAIVGPVTVASGATLVLGGEQSVYFGTYAPTNNLLTDNGNLIVEGNGGFDGNGNQWALLGTNTVLGNLTLEAGANFRIGEYYNAPTTAAFGSYTAGGEYAASTINFGANTNVSLQGATGAGNDTVLFLDLNAPAVIGGYLAATKESEVWLNAGTLTINGANNDANPFVGTLQADPGTTVIIGDSTHPNAVFGDPNNTNGSTETLNVVRTSGGVGNLMGYGTIYATVNNAGVVTAGGTKGVIGSLTISQYNQSSTGILNIEVSPTGASELKVLGTATLGGTLNLTIDAGKYGNAVIPIIQASSITGSFAEINTSGSAAAGLAETSTSYDVVTELTSSLQVFGHLVSSDMANVNQFNDQLFDNLQNAYPSSTPKQDLGGGFDVWITPFGRAASITKDGYSYNTTAEGFSGGVESKSTGDVGYGVSNASFGLAMSYANENLKTDGGATNSTSDTYDAAAYGGFDLQNARIDATVFYNTYGANVSRNLGSSGTIDSSPNARGYGASLQIGHGIYDNVLEPYLRITYADIEQQALTEKGSNLLALKIDQVDKGDFYGELGFKVHPDMTLLGGVRPELTIAVQHDFTFNSGETVIGQFSNLSGSPFSFNWKGDEATAGVVGLNLAGDVASNLQVFGKVDGRFTTAGESGELRLGAAYRF